MMKRGSRQSKFAGKRFLLVTLLVLLLVWGINFATNGFLSDIFRGAGSGVWHAKNLAGGLPFSAYFSSRESLADEIARLTEENRSLRIRSIEGEVARAENRALKRLLGREEDEQALIGASVLVWPPQTHYGSMIIDAGSEEGVTPGMLAIAADSIALGIVSEVGKSTSELSLFSAAQAETEGVIRFEDEEVEDAAITLIGKGAGQFEARVPRGLLVQKGTPVFHPGIEGYLLGRVGEIRINEADPFQLLLIERPLADRSITLVGLTK